MKAKVVNEFVKDLDGRDMTDERGQKIRTWDKLAVACGGVQVQDLDLAEWFEATARQFVEGQPFDVTEEDVRQIRNAVAAAGFPAVLSAQLSRELKAWAIEKAKK